MRSQSSAHRGKLQSAREQNAEHQITTREQTVKSKRTPNRIRRAISKDAVLKSARTLFVTRGYLATSVDDIARRGGLSKGGLYFHFSDKSQILIELLGQSSAIYSGIVEKLNNSKIDPRDRIAIWVNDVSRLGAEEPELILLPILISLEFLGKNDEIERMVKLHYAALYGGLMTAIRHGQKIDVFHRALPVKELAASLAALADGALLEWLRRKRQLSGRSFVRALRHFAMTGIALAPSRKSSIRL